MESKKYFDRTMAGIQDRNVAETVTGLMSMMAQLIPKPEGVTPHDLKNAEENLARAVDIKFTYLYELSKAHFIEVPALRPIETIYTGALTVFLSPSFHHSELPQTLTSPGAVFISIEPSYHAAPEIVNKYSEVGDRSWHYVVNREAARKKRRRLAPKRETSRYHNSRGDTVFLSPHKQDYFIQSSEVGVRLDVSALSRPIEGLPALYQSFLGEWRELFPLRMEQLCKPVVMIANNSEMDQVFHRLELSVPARNEPEWNFARDGQHIRGVVLLKKEEVKSGATMRLNQY
ncbi:MAG: hypothetical protein M3Q44_02790 [bacterium]|nr:hypothetical protein [bacterium]